ncbi:hypothetical protein MMC19_004151 [Ptychographa xylographoides]|nr:hypothetical protein [Ptychographa xylographoides]
MTGLQVLKLRNLQLRDEDIEVLADAIGIRVRSLDLRHNRITDASVRTLLTKCFHPTRNVQTSQLGRSRALNRASEEDWPSGVARPDSHLLNEYRGEDLDERFLRRLTQGVVDRMPSEDLPSTGLTHLYIAHNFISVEGVASLLKTENLHVLDAGTSDTAKALGGPRNRSSFSRPPGYSISLPGAEKLTPVLERFASKNLTYLRLHHAVVTETAVFKDDILAPLELPADAVRSTELDSTEVRSYELDTADSSRYEMDGEVPVYEMSADGTASPRYELAGDSMHMVVSPAIGDAPSPTFEEQHFPTVRRGSAFAPEVLEAPATIDEDEEPVLLSATGLGTMAQAINGIHTSSSRGDESPLPTKPTGEDEITSVKDNMKHNVAMLEQERKDLRAHSVLNPHGLSPGALPALRTLVLTDVPNEDKNGHVVNGLKKFLEDCATEFRLAGLQASLEHPLLYVPGKPRSMHLQHRVRELFALKRIILEMAPPKLHSPANTDGSSSPRTPPPQGWLSSHKNRSSTEDPDTAAFWSAQENDFSFFGDEECGLPASETMHFPLSTLSEKMVLPMEALQSESLPTLQQPNRINTTGGMVDVVQELAKFRREKKADYENGMKYGKKYVDGYWPGEVKIVRDLGGRKNGNYGDWYGNYFEKGVCR